MASLIRTTTLGDRHPTDNLLVVLPGALLDGPNAMLERLATKRRLLLVHYGSISRMDELVEGIAQLVSDHGCASADVIGSSYGGWVAQCLMLRRPDRVRRVVLSHTFALRPADARTFRIGLALWPMFPRSVLLALIGLRARRALAPLRQHSAERYAAAVEYVRTTTDRPGALEGLMAQNRCMLDSLTAPSRRAVKPAHRMLILESTDDPLIRRSAREHLRSRYPEATVHSFSGSGHVSALTSPDQFAEVVERFLDQSTTH